MWQSAVGKIRYRSIKLEDGILKADGGYGMLSPFTKPDLPTEFTKVEDGETAIRFEVRYAPLGYDRLVKSLEEQKHGDPLEWVLMQSNFVRTAMNLVYDIGEKDGFDALKQLKHCGIHWKAERYSEPRVRPETFAWLTFPDGAYSGRTSFPIPKTDREALWYARPFVALLVNANTRSLHQRLVVHQTKESDTKEGMKAFFSSVLFYDSLIEAIWSMVGELAIRIEEGHEDGYLKRCDWCQSVFWTGDKRQRFCPRPEGDKVERNKGERRQSLCGLKYRQHNLKVKDEKKGAK